MKEERKRKYAPHSTDIEIMLLLNLLTKHGHLIGKKIDQNSHSPI